MKANILEFIEELEKTLNKNENSNIGSDAVDINHAFTKIIDEIKDTREIAHQYERKKAPVIKLFEPNIWSKDEFYHSKHILSFLKKRKKHKYSVKMEFIDTLEFKNIKLEKFVSELTALDMQIYKQLHPSELLEYPNIEKCPTLSFFIKKNNMLEKMIVVESCLKKNTIRYFIDAAKLLLEAKSINSYVCFINSLKKIKLSEQEFDEVIELGKIHADYFEMQGFLEKNSGNLDLVFPLEYMLKYAEDVHDNQKSNIAAKNFCLALDYISKTQKHEIPKRFYKVEHFLYSKLVNYKDVEHKIEESEKEESAEKEIGSVFLFCI